MNNVKWEAVYVIHVIASGVSLFAIMISLQFFFLAFFLANVLAGALVAGIIYFDNEKIEK